MSLASRKRSFSASFSLYRQVACPSILYHQDSMNSVFVLHCSTPSLSAISCVALSELNQDPASLTLFSSVASLSGPHSLAALSDGFASVCVGLLSLCRPTESFSQLRCSSQSLVNPISFCTILHHPARSHSLYPRCVSGTISIIPSLSFISLNFIAFTSRACGHINCARRSSSSSV